MRHWEHLSVSFFFLAHSGLHIVATLVEHTRDQNKMVGITLAASCTARGESEQRRFVHQLQARRCMAQAAWESAVPYSIAPGQEERWCEAG